MAERIIMNEVKKFEWESMMSMTGNKLSKFNAIDQNLNCSQLMRNAGLDWTVNKVPVQATIDDKVITSDKLFSLVKSNDNKILVSGGTNGVDVFEFSLQTKGWSKAIGKIEENKTNSILDIDDKIKYMTSTKIYNWLDTPSEGFIRILTKDFDFGNPAQRKKCFKFYVTYKSAAASNTLVYFGMNGETLTADSPGGAMKDNSKFAGTNDVAYSTTTGLATTSGEWKQVELKPATSINNKYSVQLHFITKASSTTPSSFEINDITIIYRPKPLK